MRFDDPAALGAWASQHQVTRATFHADGTLKSAEFFVMPAMPEGVDGGDAPRPDPAREKVNQALRLLAAS